MDDGIFTNGIALLTETGNNKTRMEPQNSPAYLLPPEILEFIFLYSDLASVKIFRLVCRKWNKIAVPCLRRKSTINLSPARRNNFTSFNATFDSSQMDLPFSAIKLTNNSISRHLSWDCTELDTFFEQWTYAIKSLEFHQVNIKFPGNIKDDDKCYELSPALQSNLTTLILDCTKSVKISVSVNHLTELKTIKLIGGAILRMGTDKVMLIPTEIELKQPLIRYSDANVACPVHINDFIDFTNAKKVLIHALLDDKPQLTLDMTTAITVNELSLRHVNINLGDVNKWTVKGLLSLSQIPWVQSNEMKFFQLHFHDGVIDISQLPPTLEYLRLSYANVKCSGYSLGNHATKTILPNLKFLAIKSDCDFPEYFRNCPNLVEIDLSECYHHGHDNIIYPHDGIQTDGVQFENLPINFKNMQIHPRTDFYSLVDRQRLLEFDTLIVKEWLLPSTLKSALNKKLKPRRLLLDFTDVTPKWEKCKKLLQDIKTNQDIEEIYLGPVQLASNSRFLEYVDKTSVDFEGEGSASLYRKDFWFKFENKVGKAIPKLEFDRIRKLYQGKIPRFNEFRQYVIIRPI